MKMYGQSYYQRLSAVVNNVFIFDLCSELQIIHAILMESDGPSEILMDCWIIDHFLSVAMVVMRAFSRVCEEKHVIAALKKYGGGFRNMPIQSVVLCDRPQVYAKKMYRL